MKRHPVIVTSLSPVTSLPPVPSLPPVRSPRLRPRPPLLAPLALLLPPLLLGGCAVQTKSIRANYVGFNETIQFNQSQQMLLNLVRMKYRETPLFLEVGALSSSYDFEMRAQASAGKVSNISNWGVELGSSYSTRPTITYTPLQGNTYVKQVLAEVQDNTFVLLYHSGWPLRTLCHVIVEKIGDDLVNNEDDPSYDRFNAYVEDLHKAWSEGLVDLVMRDGALQLQRTRVGPDGARREEMRPFADFHMRSMLDILFFLGKNTEVPPENAAQVKPSRGNGWINIHATKDVPDEALVWVEHDGWYYSIRRDDIRSKDTFALVKILFQIQAGDVKVAAPILTLPVAAP